MFNNYDETKSAFEAEARTMSNPSVAIEIDTDGEFARCRWFGSKGNGRTQPLKYSKRGIYVTFQGRRYYVGEFVRLNSAWL